MSLLDGRHGLWVQSASGEQVVDSLGVTRELEPQWVRQSATVQWNSTDETTGLVPGPGASVTIIARSWKGFPNCRIKWGTLMFEQVGPAKTFDGSPLTAHVEVKARWIAEARVELPEDYSGEIVARDGF